MKKMLFIAPYSGRAGSEMYLYRLLKSYDPSAFKALVVTEKYSPLFASLIPKIEYRCLRQASCLLPIKRFGNRIFSLLSKKKKKKRLELFLEEVNGKFQPDRWVVNTITMPGAVRLASDLKIPCTVMVHEMPSAYSFISRSDLQVIIEKADRLIANSSAACTAIAAMGRPDVCLQPCFIDIQEIKLKKDISVLQQELGIRSDEYVIAGSGSLDYNKGVELFIKIAQIAANRPWKFIWIGAERNSGYYYYLQKLFEGNTHGNLILTGERTDDYYDYLNLADLILLTSYNESFSLVSLEAMALGKPVLAYNCGGISDFLSEECGKILQTRNPEEWITAIEDLFNAQLSDSRIHVETAKLYSTDKQIPNLVTELTRN